MRHNRKILFFIICFFLLSYFCLISSINGMVELKPITDNNGSTLYVGGSGPGNYTMIQDALNDASNGDTIYVYPGIYYERHLIINKSIKLEGQNKSNTIIDGGETNNDILIIEANYVIIQGFTIQRSGFSRNGILILSNNNLISDSYVLDNAVCGIAIFDSAKENLVQHCYFEGQGWNIYIQGWDEISAQNIISKCYFQGGTILLSDAQFNQIVNCTLYGGRIDLDVRASNNIVKDCYIESAPSDAISIEGRGNVVESCHIINSDLEGMRIWGDYGGQDTLIKDCKIINSNFSAIIFWGDSINNIITGCEIVNNREGIAFFGGIERTRVFNNNLSNNIDGIELWSFSLFNWFYKNNMMNVERQIWTQGKIYMFNFFFGNYWSDYDGSGPYQVYGKFNWDILPAKEPYDY